MSKNYLAGGVNTPRPQTPTQAPAGPVQVDGNVIAQQPAPTKAPLQPRSASPANMNTSGIEAAMGAHADKVHPVKRR
jgi:hypothetical protein